MQVDILHNCQYLHPYSGNIFYQFEYYIYLLKKGVDVRLIFTPSCDVDRIMEIMCDRYNLDDIDYISGVYSDGIVRSPNVITTTKTLYDLNGDIQSDSLYVVDTWASFYHKKEIDVMISNMNAKRYNECPWCGDVNYTRPIYFDLLKRPIKSNDAIYLHIAGNARHISIGDFIRYISPIVKGRRVVVSYTKEQERYLYFLKSLDVEAHIDHTPNLFERFDTYMYVLLRGFDFSPRMILESCYFDKKIIYLDNTLQKSAMTRYQDCINGNIGKYGMSDNDPLIRNFI